MLVTLSGALGLFLLGMWLMTEGLKMAGGRALKELLGRWTSSRLRGLGAGTLITALVQSSGAVTIATIGFVNTGLMTFQQALWVVFGSNIGTTFTAWIVTFLGFTLEIDAVTYLLVGVGAALRVFVTHQRLSSLGMALAGFGLLFMGIDALRDTFASVADQIDVGTLLASSGYPTLLAVLTGLVLTVLTQSSSASITIILTAVATAVAPLPLAAAAVIGANIGSTSTALLATIGATANARRLAVAHIAFNLITATVALLALPLFLQGLLLFSEEAAASRNPAVLLALFHTGFNILGVLLMWPLEPLLSRALLGLFRRASPRHSVHLDANIATVPDLAIRAATLELKTLLDAVMHLTLRLSAEAPGHATQWLRLQAHLEEINSFIERTMQSELTRQQGSLLAAGLAVSHYLHNACETYGAATERLRQLPPSGISAPLLEWLNEVNALSCLMLEADEAGEGERASELTANYRRIKEAVIAMAVAEKLPVHQVDDTLLIASLARRYMEQLIQALQHYRQLATELQRGGPQSAPAATSDTQ